LKLKELLYLVAGILLTATLIPMLMSATELDISAQISPRPTATNTPTPITPTPTDTPIPPTNTPTPIPPTPTDTPIPPTPTDTPIPPTPTPTPTPPAQQLSAITIEPPEAVAAVGVSLDFTVVFTDPEAAPDFATWYWGDGDTTTCSIGVPGCEVLPGSSTQGTLVASHTYSEPGVYTVQATVKNNSDGGYVTSTYEYVVVYDPGAGFVTGGGWIDSAPGTFAHDPTLTGKARFGFVSEYEKGSSRPTGNTEFRFKVADLSFHSDTYDWLVVNRSGDRAQFKGSGTINGAVAPNGEDYRFMIWASDGSYSDTVDTFRGKIWYEDGDPEEEIVLYDNKVDDSEVAQAIGGGNIIVHKPSKKK
jgi:hypothetical protein